MNYFIIFISLIVSFLPTKTDIISSNNITLSTSFNTNQWIDFSWTSVPGAVTYEIEGIEHSGNGVIVKEGTGFSARAYPTADPYGIFTSFELGTFGYATFRIYAYDSNGSLVGTSNAIAYGVVYVTQQCGLICDGIGLCNISTDWNPSGTIQCE
ncbi:MAG: hypothetical protein BalsKO_24730 [Balneolaceae bacterium]